MLTKISYLTFKSIDDGKAASRDILVVDGLPFYQSTGYNSEMPDTFFPFLGIENQDYENFCWLRKPFSLFDFELITRTLQLFLNNYVHEQKKSDFNFGWFTRFSTLKGLYISALLNDARPAKRSFWQSAEGKDLKAFMIKSTPNYFKRTAFELVDSKIVIDVGTDEDPTFDFKVSIAQINTFLEEQIAKSFSINFNVQDFFINLTKFKIAEPLTGYSLHSFQLPTTTKASAIKTAKKLINNLDKENYSYSILDTPRLRYANNFKWPTDSNLLGINKEQSIETEKFIWASYPSIFKIYSDALHKFKIPAFYSYYAGEKIANVTTHLFIHFLHNGEVIVFSRIALVESERLPTIKAYNLVTGELMLIKKFGTFPAYKQLIPISGQPGLVTGINQIQLINNNEPAQSYADATHFSIENLYNNFFQFDFESEIFTSFAFKAKQILILLKGLASIHDLSLENKRFTPAYHSRISPEVIQYDAKQQEFLLSGFEAFGEVNRLHYSDQYISPELAQFMLSRYYLSLTEKDIIDFNTKNGQAIDIWNLALIFVILLNGPSKNRSTQNNNYFPKLFFIHHRLDSNERHKFYLHNMSQLKQKEIDTELNQILLSLNNTPEGQKLFMLWSIVVAMLKVDPGKRMPARDLANKLENFLAKQNECEQSSTNPTSCDHEPTSRDHGPTPCDHGPTSCDHGPTSCDHGPTSCDHGPTPCDHGPTPCDLIAGPMLGQ